MLVRMLVVNAVDRYSAIEARRDPYLLPWFKEDEVDEDVSFSCNKLNLISSKEANGTRTLAYRYLWNTSILILLISPTQLAVLICHIVENDKRRMNFFVGLPIFILDEGLKDDHRFKFQINYSFSKKEMADRPLEQWKGWI